MTLLAIKYIYTGIHLNWGIMLSFYIFIKYLYCENKDIFQQLLFKHANV